MNRKRLIITSFFFIILLSAVAFFLKNDIQSQTEEILSQVKVYENGQNREQLSRLYDLIKKAYDSPEDLAVIEKSMLKLLQSDATYAAKQFICQQLNIIGTEAAVPVLADMLKNEKEADIALYALESINGDKVDEMLRKALSESTGRSRIGIINAIGKRCDTGAVDQLAELLNDSDEAAVVAAAAALGQIGNDASAVALGKAASNITSKTKQNIQEAYLCCADQFLLQGDISQAAEIYKILFTKDNALAIRSAALIGKINTAGKEGDLEILSIIQSGDNELKPVAISMLSQVPSTYHLDKIVAELPNLSVENQVQLLFALSDLGDESVHQSVIKSTQNPDIRVRTAALKALADLGNSQDVLLLAKKAALGQDVEKQVAGESLNLLNASGTDEAIKAAVSISEGDIKIELIKAIAGRGVDSSVELLFNTAQDKDRIVRIQSLKSLALVAGPDHIDRLLNLLINVQNEAERKEAEKTVIAVAQKIEPQSRQGDAVIDKLSAVDDEDIRGSFLQVLGRIADKDALPVLREALSDKNSAVHIAAIRALSSWPTSEPAADLLNVAKTVDNQVQKILALRGFIGLAGLESDQKTEKAIDMYKTAMKLSASNNEKRLILSGLSNVRSLSALETVAGYLENGDLKQEAEVAAVQIAWKISSQYPGETKKIMTRILDTSTNERVKSNARRILINIDEQ